MKNDRVLPPGKVLSPLHAGPGTPEQGNKANQLTGVPLAARDRARQRPKPLSRGGGKPHDTPPGKSERFQVLNDFVDVQMRELSHAAVRAWLVLYRDTKPNGLAKTGLTDLARRAGFSLSTAKRAVRELVDRGLAKPVHRGRKGSGPSVYRVVGVGSTGTTAG